MEAAKLKRKKGNINKGKVKKSLKNVICRPDPVFWPIITDDEASSLSNILMKHRVDIPDFKKLHWNELKLMPKSERPKQQPIQKIEGLLFGITACKNAIESKKCSAVIIEALVEPQIIVHSIIEACTSTDIPVICLKDLRILTKHNFGIKTSCLGTKKDSLIDISNNVKTLYLKYKPKLKKSHEDNSSNTNVVNNILVTKDSQMDINTDLSSNPYLFRTDKKTRVFVPSNKPISGDINRFVGQNFIKFAEKKEQKMDSKNYMRMMLKKISNNPNRVKVK